MRIAIIGCGYVGSALGKTLAASGHDVVGTTTTSSRVEELRPLGIKLEVVHIADVERLHEILSGRDVVYLTIAPSQRGADYRDVYLAASESLIEAAKNTPVRRIIYTSSTRVYGQDDGSWVDESSPTEPKDENGRVLLQTEEALRRHSLKSCGEPPRSLPLAKGGEGGVVPEAGTEQPPADAKSSGTAALRAVHPVPTTEHLPTLLTQQCYPSPPIVTVLRLGGIYGPDRDYARRIRGLAGTERSDGGLYLNLIHLDDIVEALVALLSIAYHGVLNLVDDHPEQRRTLYDRVLSEAGLAPICWVHDEQTARLGKRVRNDLIRRTLNLELKYPTH